MEHWKRFGQEINRLLKPQTFPLAVRLAGEEGQIPARAKRPGKDLGKKLAPCQGAALARKYGWTMAVQAEDSGCAIASFSYGWAPQTDRAKAVEFLIRMNYTRDQAAAEAALSSWRLLAPGKCRAVIYAPLEKTEVDPDVILLYINPAQLMRLIHGATYRTGIPITSSFSGRAASCTEGVLGAYLDRTAKVVVPGNGDRVWGTAQDDEMAFVVPAELLEGLIEGLSRTHERGIRYPIPAFLDYQPMVGLKLPLTDIFK